MDLNYYYARHQISLINAKEATSTEARLTHRRVAAPYAEQVNAHRRNLPVKVPQRYDPRRDFRTNIPLP